jgi:hypothetical protein
MYAFKPFWILYAKPWVSKNIFKSFYPPKVHKIEEKSDIIEKID